MLLESNIQIINQTKTLFMKKIILTLLLTIAVISFKPSFAQISGNWHGSLIINENTSLTIAVEIKQITENCYKAVLHSVDQKAFNIDVDSVHFSDSRLFMSIKSLRSEYMGKLTGGQSLEGDMQFEDGTKLKLDMKQTDEFPFSIARRPQEPSLPYPYISDNAQFTNPTDDIILRGTITTPSTTGKHPAIVLISGSGPSDRNQTIFGHKTFLVISDFLTKAGYVVLRYDDRGAGESEGDFITATIIDHARDASYAINYLKSLDYVDTNSIGVLGHSLGADIAPVVASINNTLSFAILMGGAAKPLSDVILEQCRAIYHDKGIKEEAIALNEKILEKMFSIIKEENNIKKAKEKASAALEIYEEEALAIDQKEMESLGLSTPLNIKAWASLFLPYMQYDLFHDNSFYLTSVDCPVLVIGGEKDLQILPHHVSLIEQILTESGNNQVTAKLYKGKNHLMQDAVTGAPSEYGDIENTIAPDVIEDIIAWLNSL